MRACALMLNLQKITVRTDDDECLFHICFIYRVRRMSVKPLAESSQKANCIACACAHPNEKKGRAFGPSLGGALCSSWAVGIIIFSKAQHTPSHTVDSDA
jgi:hypothetical protein